MTATKSSREQRPPNSRKPSPAPQAPEAPKWTRETPDVFYSLEAYLGENLETVDLTLDEYIALKAVLAKRRGLPFSAKEHRLSCV